MIHLVGERASNTLKVFGRGGALFKVYRAGFDAWGNYGGTQYGETPLPPWGRDCWMPEGHYVLGGSQVFSQPIPSEGFGQIPIYDFTGDQLAELERAGDVTLDGLDATIGGLTQPIGQLAAYARSAMMIHCGGSNAPDPLADDQGLYRTFGCTRMLNADWRELVAWLEPLTAGNRVVYTATEQPADLGQ